MPEKIHNLPITGIASFAKYPICTDLDALDDADVCVMGIPYDMGAPYLSGAKFGPRRIREVSCHYGRGDAGFWDPERLEQYLAAPVKIVDGGEGVSGFLCLGRLFQGQPNEAALCFL